MNTYDRKKELQEFDDTKAGVKGLLEAGVTKIPRIFVNEQYISESKLISDGSKFSIPIIDLECLNMENARGGIIDQVKDACQNWGFFQMVNHGIPTSLMKDALDSVKKFHELDAEVKKPYYSRDYTKKVVYNSNFDLHQTHRPNWRDSLYLLMAPNPPEPQELPQVLRDTIMEYSKQIKKLGIILMELISEALGLDLNHLTDMSCCDGMYVTAHYYPPCPEPNLTLGHTSHTDIAFLAILLQDHIGGLQVLHQDQWVNVQPSPGALVVNIGDLMQLITNAKFKSVYHRVLANHVGPRVSLGFFFRMHLEPNSSSKIYGPIVELLSEDNPPIYREIMAEEIVACRYAKGFDDTPLLSHFKLKTTD